MVLISILVTNAEYIKVWKWREQLTLTSTNCQMWFQWAIKYSSLGQNVFRHCGPDQKWFWNSKSLDLIYFEPNIDLIRKKTVIFGLTLFPLRVIILLISMIPSFLIGLLTDRFVNPDIRPVGWRYLLSQSAVRLGQVQLYIAGIVFDKTGEPADPSEAPILVIGPHSTIIDGFW